MSKKVCLQFFLLCILVLFSAEECVGDGIFCDNTTFIGKEPIKLQSSDYKPCDDEESICFLIPSKSQKICQFVSANYSFNFSSTGYCSRYKQSALSPCELLKDGIKCRYSKLSICHSKDLLWCALNINVFVTFGITVLKQFVLQMPQSSTYVKSSSLRVSKLQLKVESDTTIQFSWSWPKCKSPDYIFNWTLSLTGSNVLIKTKETLSLSNEDFKHFKQKITNLKPFTMYTICIKSKVDEVLFPYHFINGPCESARTLEAPPSMAPELLTPSLSHTSKSKFQCLIKWKNVDKKYWNGIVKAVTINLYKKEDIHKPKTFSVPLNKTSYTIHSLDMKTDYLVELELCNGAGCSHSNKKFIAWKPSKAPENFSLDGIPWKIILITVVCLLVIIVLLVLAVIKKWRDRHATRTTSVEALVPDNDEYHSEHMYEEIRDNAFYDRIDDVVPSTPPPGSAPVNTLLDDQNMHQDHQIERGKHDHGIAGPSTCNVPVLSRENVIFSTGNSPCGSLQEPPYRTICDCGTHVESLHLIGACNRTEPLKTNVMDSERLFNNIDQMESSEDDHSHCESYELNSSPSVSSISSENAVLVRPSSRSFQDSQT